MVLWILIFPVPFKKLINYIFKRNIFHIWQYRNSVDRHCINCGLVENLHVWYWANVNGERKEMYSIIEKQNQCGLNKVRKNEII